MIEVKELTFSYGRVPVLCGLSFTLAPGELCSVVGVNGCGKTTLLSLLSRRLSPSGGTIEVDGRRAESYSSKEYARKISLLSQERQVSNMAVADYVAAGRYPYVGFSGRMTREDENAVACAVKAAGIEAFLHKRLTELSGGERQRVYFALLMAQDTPYVLMDEPCSHLDLPSAVALNGLVSALRDSGKAVLSVSHDLSAAMKCSDRILLLDRGRLVYDGVPDSEECFDGLERVFGVCCHKVSVDGQIEYFFKKDL